MSEYEAERDYSSIKCIDMPQARVPPEALGLGDKTPPREARTAHQYVAVRLAALSELAQLTTAQAMALALTAILHDRLEGKPLRSSQQRAKEIGLSRWQWARAVEHLPASHFTVTKEPGKPTAVGLTPSGRQLFHPPGRAK